MLWETIMKKLGLICATLLAGLSLSACNNMASQQSHHSSSSSRSSVSVVKHHKKESSSKRSSSNNSSTQISSSSAASQSSSTKTSNASSVDTNDPRVQTAIQKGLMNPDGTLTRNGRDLEAMMNGTKLDQSDWNDSDYTETYNDGQVGRAPIYGDDSSSAPAASSMSAAPSNN